MSRLNDVLFEVGTDLAKYPGSREDDALSRRAILRKAFVAWGDERYQEGYGDGRRDMIDARAEAHMRGDGSAGAEHTEG